MNVAAIAINVRRIFMVYRSSTGLPALAAALTLTLGGVAAAADAKYPSWKGQWIPVIAPGAGGQSFDPTKPGGAGQQAPLAPEYQRILQDSLADQANGGGGQDPTRAVYPPRLPAPGGSPRQ